MQIDIEEGKRVLKIEAQAIIEAAERLDETFVQAIDLIISCKGKVIVSGMGKSGQVGQKISSTLSSTGTPSLFLSPAEGSHGDLGVITSDDIVIGISYGGESKEMVPLLNYVKRKGVKLIAFTGNVLSSLGSVADVAINLSVREEACPLQLAPTSSSTVTLAIGDALAMGLLKRRGFSEKDFAEFHPGGSLGRRLLTRVFDVMRTGEEVPVVEANTPIAEVVSLMTAKEVRGVTAVIDKQKNLIGAITDGDIRRHIQKSSDPLNATASSLMSRNPKTIDRQAMAEKALFVMEQFQIQNLFVVDKESDHPMHPVGLVHLHDLLREKIR